MNEFDYIAPSNLSESLEHMRVLGRDAKPLAGGTDLVLRIRSGRCEPLLLVDLRLLPLATIEIKDGQLFIGARVTHQQVIKSSLLARHFPTLCQACHEVAGPPVRVRGTIGGNLANASPAADAAPPLLVYDAEVVLKSYKGERTLPLVDFYRGYGQTVLRADELLVTIRATMPPANTSARFLKLGKRKAMAIAIVSVAARLSLDDSGRIETARVALGSVAPTPIRAKETEVFLEGRRLSSDVLARAAQIAADEVTPISDLRASAEYRRKMAGVLVGRALADAWVDLTGEVFDA